MQTENQLSGNVGNGGPQKSAPQHEAGPRDKKDKALSAETEDTDIVNGQSQNQVTNTGDELSTPSDSKDEAQPNEEDEDEKLNNARDAFNDDSYALPPDERDDGELN